MTIFSITFVVNGVERVLYEGMTLQASPGDTVRVREAAVCTGSFSGKGGEACVDIVPVDAGGREITSEHAGTHMLRVTPGFITLSGPDHSWTIGESWAHFSAVLNHWPPEATADSGCANGRCERDDRMIVPLR